MAKTLRSQYRGLGFDPWSATTEPECPNYNPTQQN